MVQGVITHLPNQIGYHSKRFDIVRLSLLSLRQNAGRDVAVYIWDNGSCEELREWIIEEYKPEYLTLTSNMGKSNARTAIMRTFAPGTVVGIADDDMYYYPNWLDPQLELLEKFPDVGAVSGYPVRTQFKWGTDSTLEWARKNAALSEGRFISEELDKEFCRSIGRKYDFHVRYTRSKMDYKIAYNGLEAYATAHHCQFLTYAERLEYIVEWNDEMSSNEIRFDKAIDSEGWLRLTTIERLTRHMGNVLDPDLREHAEQLLHDNGTD